MLACVLTAAALSGLLGVWALWYVVRGRPVLFKQLVGAAVVEVALVAQLVAALVATGAGASPTEPWTFWGYVITALFLLPVAAVWAMADRTRTSSLALLVVCVALVAMQARIWQVWAA
ncbi:hypothetical protein [Georgenia alba]|uniref:Integral membrane protein n=1 Tax=Georgenia alba TaxID=2233858 RepID=A0ABW2Q981_9MICO